MDGKRRHDYGYYHDRDEQDVKRHENPLQMQLSLRKEHQHAECAAYRCAYHTVEGVFYGGLGALLYTDDGGDHGEKVEPVPVAQPTDKPANENRQRRLNDAHAYMEMVVFFYAVVKEYIAPALHYNTSGTNIIYYS